jgi:hypothetical protein
MMITPHMNRWCGILVRDILPSIRAAIADELVELLPSEGSGFPRHRQNLHHCPGIDKHKCF